MDLDEAVRWFAAGFLAATAAAAVLHAPHALAQEIQTSTSVARVAVPRGSVADTPALRTSQAPGLRTDPLLDGDGSYVTPAEVPSDDELAQSDPQDSLDDPPETAGDERAQEGEQYGMPRLRRTLDDGDLGQAPDAATGARDGNTRDAEPILPADGGDPNLDTRPPEDRAVFDNPPAGFDPQLFQIETIEPVETDRRPAQLARLDPYEPVGIKIGSFIWFPEMELAGIATSNVLASSPAQSDVAADTGLSSRLVSNWTRHAIELRGSTAARFWNDYSSEDQRTYTLELRGRYDVSKRTNLELQAVHGVSQEKRTGIDANLTGENGDITRESARLALNHRFNRLSVQLRGGVADADFADTDGQSNAARNVLQTDQAVRTSWELKPTLSVFGEVGFVQLSKDNAADGSSRDSHGERYRVGLNFGGTGALLRGEISVGYGEQRPESPTISRIGGFLIDANLAWRPTEITSLLFTAQSEIQDTVTSTSVGVLQRTVGIEARHALRRYLVASAGFAYTDYDYGADPTEQYATTTFLGAEYFASPEIVLSGRYQHNTQSTSPAGPSFNEDQVRLGLKLRK